MLSDLYIDIEEEYTGFFNEPSENNLGDFGSFSSTNDWNLWFFSCAKEDQNDLKYYTPPVANNDVYFSTHDISPCGNTDALSYARDSGSVADCNVSNPKMAQKSYATKPNWSKFVADLPADEVSKTTQMDNNIPVECK